MPPPSSASTHAHDSAPRAALRALRDDPGLRGLVIALILVGALFLIQPFRYGLRGADVAKDYGVWFNAGQVVLAGADLYPPPGQGEFPYMYPPTPAVLLFAPLARLGLPALVLGLGLLNIAAWIASILLAVRLATGSARNAHPIVYLLPLAVTGPFVWDTFWLGQPNLILLATVLFAFFALERARPIAAGTALAAAAAFKVFPVLLAGYLVYRRAWRALAAMLVALALLLAVVPGPFRGFQRNLAELDRWSAGMIFKKPDEGIAQRAVTSFDYGNQSILGVAHRFLRPVEAGWDPKPFTINLTDLGPTGATAVAAALMLALALAAVIAWNLGPRHPPLGPRSPSLHAAPARPDPRRFESAMVTILAVVCSPIAWTYYFCWLLFPLVVLVAFLFERHQPEPVRRTVLAGLILALLVLGSALWQSIDHRTQAAGVTLWGSLIVFATLALAAARRVPEAASAPAEAAAVTADAPAPSAR